MADQQRPLPPGRGSRNRPPTNRPPVNRPSSAPLTGPLTVDTATSDALVLFNARLAAQAENERAERRVHKAAKTKDDAAARVRSVENDPKATAAQRADATAAYRASVDAWERAKSGEPEPPRARAGAGDPTDGEAAPDEVQPTAAPDEAESAVDEAAPDASPTADEAAPDESQSAADEAQSADEPHEAAPDAGPTADEAESADAPDAATPIDH